MLTLTLTMQRTTRIGRQQKTRSERTRERLQTTKLTPPSSPYHVHSSHNIKTCKTTRRCPFAMYPHNVSATSVHSHKTRRVPRPLGPCKFTVALLAMPRGELQLLIHILSPSGTPALHNLKSPFSCFAILLTSKYTRFRLAQHIPHIPTNVAQPTRSS